MRMKVLAEIGKISSVITSLKSSDKRIGFVPTMGALHEGHLSLIRASRASNDVTVVSIFVNPTQFDKKEDFLKYPKSLDKDLELLKQAGCDLVFTPASKNLYPKDAVSATFDFGGIEKEMEGKFRDNHFNGVATIVKKLFEIVQPNNAYFGEKDFQQLQIIKNLTIQLGLPTEVHGCPIYREKDGLAMSSRNVRLTPLQRDAAPFVHKILKEVKIRFENHTVSETKDWVAQQFQTQPLLDLEYFEITDEDTLQSASSKNTNQKQRAFIAVFAGAIRLIDNMPL